MNRFARISKVMLCQTVRQVHSPRNHGHTSAGKNMGKMMRAAQVDKHGGRIKVVQVATPEPEDGEVLVKICRCGFCHTDVHAIDGDWQYKSILPLTPGHEGCGTVAKLGPNAEKHGIAIGDRVGIPWLHHSCLTCEYCLSGWESLCEKQKNAGFSVQGGMADYAIAKSASIVRIPDGLSMDQAAPILCAGVTTYKAIKETECKPGEFCTIIGSAGGLGHLAVQYAKAMGLRVIALDVGKKNLDYSLELGAEFAIDATDKKVVEKIQEVTGGGTHGVVVLAPHPTAFTNAIAATRRKGTCVFVGLPSKADIDLNVIDVVLKRVTIRGSIVGTRKDMIEAMDFAARGLVKCDVTLADLDECGDVYDKLKGGKVQGRIVLKINDE